jgi:eukaryotic-like serine/threonine-protein kinase
VSDLATQATLALGAGVVIADRYEIRGLLGQGGMGAVYRVLDRELDEEVALKILRPELAATPEALVRFRREVKLARRVTHGNVARTYDLGEYEGVRFLTMELIAGSSLRAAPARDLPEVLRIAHEVSIGLAAAHAVGVVHRDLKPDNVMLTNERVVLTDFGIARAADGNDRFETSGKIVGTPAYIAPEQLEGSDVDGRADVFALGVMMYEQLAKRLPFDDAFARLARAPASLVPAVPESIARLVMDALARRRDERPDAHTMASRLAKLRGGGGVDEVRVVQTTEIVAPNAQRTVRIAQLDADDATRALAADLATAISDSLASEVTVRLVKDGADESIDATIRASGDRVRVRLRIADARGEVVWADRVEGSLGDPFALEDAVAERAKAALRVRASQGAGPPGPLRERYGHARDRINGELSQIRAAVAELEQLDRESPDDPWVTSLLACGLVNIAMQTGASDEALFGRAEELALRALDRDPTNGQAFAAVAQIRSAKADHVGALAAAREALRRLPLQAVAHYQIGRILCHAGRVAEGLTRLDLVLRLDPRLLQAADERVRTLALMGDRALAERELARFEQARGELAALPRLRLFSWWQDRALAAETAKALAAMTSGASWASAAPILEAYVTGDTAKMMHHAAHDLPTLTHRRVIPRQLGMMYEISIEIWLLCGGVDEATRLLGELAQTPGYINLLWLDRCPLLGPLRDGAAFAQARAVTAARVAQLL